MLSLAVITLALGSGCSTSGGGADEGGSGGTSSGGAASGSGGSSSSGSGGTGSTGGSVSSGGTSSGTGGSIFSSGGTSSGGSNTGGTGGTGGTYQCTGDGSEFETFDKSCTTVDDCVLVTHVTTCCGDSLWMGINESEAARFSTVEGYCSAQFPACGCAAQGVTAEDGTLVQYGNEDKIVLECTGDGECKTRYGGETFQCAGAVCTGEQTCNITIGGPAGSEPHGYCNPNLGCTSCDCISRVGCTCTEQDGLVTVTCAAP
jgi:hypothetical protein